MSGTLALVVLVAIFALAAFLVALPRLVHRREAPRRAQPRVEVGSAPEASSAGAAMGKGPGGEAAVASLEVVPTEVRLRDRLGKTRATFAGLLGHLRRGGHLDAAAWEELEETLLLADVGLTTTEALVAGVRARAAGDGDAARLPVLLREEITERLRATGRDRVLHHASEGPTVWFLVGVNGAGKTTTAAKLARREQEEGRRVLLAAADTFRAAAADQLATWAKRLGCEIVRGAEGGDPGAVVFDAIDAAVARGVDVVLVDTAGRLHTKVNLMKELEKLQRVAERRPGAVQEVLLVLDATTGQNGLAQAREFAEAVDVTGVVLTKLDGSAKGGVVLAIEAELGVPVKLVGLGEGPDDLIPFEPAEFAAALVE